MNTFIHACGLVALGLCGASQFHARDAAAAPENAAFFLPAASVQRVLIDVGDNNVNVRSTHAENASLVLTAQRWDESCRVESVCDGETWSVRVRPSTQCVADITLYVPPTTAVRHIGGAGAFTLQDVSGDLQIATGEGAIQVSTHSRQVHLKSRSGDVDLTMASDAQHKPMVSVSTGSGAVRIKAQASVRSAALFVSTEGGHAVLELPQTASLDLRHDELDLPASNEVSIQNDGRFLLRTCGSIDVKLRA